MFPGHSTLFALLICAVLIPHTRAVCGDGVRGGDDCDDGNEVDGDGCSGACTIETGYECDPNSNPSMCASTCVGESALIVWSPPNRRYSGSNVLDPGKQYKVPNKEECARLCLSRHDCAVFEWKSPTDLCAMAGTSNLADNPETATFSGRKVCVEQCSAIDRPEEECYSFPCRIEWEWHMVPNFTGFHQHPFSCQDDALVGAKLIHVGSDAAWQYECCPQPNRTTLSDETEAWTDEIGASSWKVYVQMFNPDSPISCPDNSVLTGMHLKKLDGPTRTQWEYNCTDLTAYTQTQRDNIFCQWHSVATGAGHGSIFTPDSWRELEHAPLSCETHEALNFVNMTVDWQSGPESSFDVTFDYRCCSVTFFRDDNVFPHADTLPHPDTVPHPDTPSNGAASGRLLLLGGIRMRNCRIRFDTPVRYACYANWTSDQCMEAGDNYTWCGGGTASPPVVTTPPTEVTSPPTSPPSFIDNITDDDVGKIKEGDSLNDTEVGKAIDELLEEEEDAPPIDSVDAFADRLVRAIQVAAALKNASRDSSLPNGTEGDTKAQKRVIMRALLKDLNKVATERGRLGDVSSSGSEVLLSAATLATTIEAADEAETDEIDDTAMAVNTFASLVTVSRRAIAQTDNATPQEKAKALSGVGHYLDAAAGLFRQLNRTAKSLRAPNRRLSGDGATPTYNDMAWDIRNTTSQLGDSLVSRVALLEEGKRSVEVASAEGGTSMRVATRDQADEAMLSMGTAEQSVAVGFPSAVDSSTTNCGGQMNTAESVQLVWWSDDPFQYASSDEQQDPANVTTNNTLTRAAAQGTFTISGRRCGSDMQLRASAGGEPFRIFLPRPPSHQLRRSLQQTANGNMTVVVEDACGFWNDTTTQWDTQGCRVNEVLSNSSTLCCECDHLTDFGSVFRSVIVDSSIADVLGGADESLKRIGDITAIVQNVAGIFVFIMIAIHLVCLAVSIYFDCKHPITNEILLDIWMTDPLLVSVRKTFASWHRFASFYAAHRMLDTLRSALEDSINRVNLVLPLFVLLRCLRAHARAQRTRLQKGIHQCSRRAYHPFWCDFLVCRIVGGCWLFCKRREPTVHLQELRTLRQVRQELLHEPPKQRPREDSLVAIEQAKPPVVSNMPSSTDKKPWSDGARVRRFSLSTALTGHQADTAQTDSKSLRYRVQEALPSLTDFIKYAFVKKQQENSPSSRFEVKKTATDLSVSGPLPKQDPNWSVMPQSPLSLAGDEPSGTYGASSPARRRASVQSVDSQVSEDHKSENEERGPQQGPRGLSFAPSVGAQMDARGMQIFQQLMREEKRNTVNLVKSGVLKEALRQRLLLELQRQQAGAVLIQRHWRALLTRKKGQKASTQLKEGEQVPDIEDTPSAKLFGRPQKKGTIEMEDERQGQMQPEEGEEEVPQDERKHRKGFEDVAAPASDSAQSPASLTSRFQTMVDSEGSPTHTNTQEEEDEEDDNADDLSPKLQKGQTIPIADALGHQQQREVKLMVDDGKKRPAHKVMQGKAAAPRRKSVTELWGDLNIEVDMMVTRTMRRVEYIEWGPTKMFKEVVRRDHPIMKLFILNPAYTAVQRVFFFGSISLGILTMCAVFFDRTRMTGEGTENVLLSFQTSDIAWKLTLRQIAVLIWSIILAKPVPIVLILLFRKTVPHIRPSPTRIADYDVPAGKSFFLAKRTSTSFAKSGRRIAEITGRHSGHFPLEKKTAVLTRWRVKARIGVAIALIYWFVCASFLVLFAFSERLEQHDNRPSYIIYQDFVLACSVETLNTFILQPIINFILLSLLLMAILRIGFCDWIVWMMPHWFDFTHVHAVSLHELTIQLQAITDTQELTRGILGFAGLNIDSIGFVQDVFSF
ncbi:unnamed protein product [Vitrella brassicaformis CCMP3155]|uniref:Apple domain-containing protein n=1 Tax=Vitrella brassicaformis (strain CCMP3155) TaxID=1169540 RepID=A0A0G4F467_VITBC|nr:unnamed protein product [Vitrella brassicaformis CCMP3155]|eukprot:CEM06651.1 unnamed protein product [Vitrella brassicaformis CCMP3155]